MYFYHLLAQHGLAELWLREGVGDKTRFIPLHVIAVKVLPATHMDVQDCVQNAERFLVQVLNRGNHCTETMDSLRFNWYNHRKSVTITDLPPTS